MEQSQQTVVIAVSLQCTWGGNVITLQANRILYLFASFHHTLTLLLSHTASCNLREGYNPHLSAQVSHVIGYRLYSPPPPLSPTSPLHKNTRSSAALCSVLPRQAPRGKPTQSQCHFHRSLRLPRTRRSLFKTSTWFHWESKWSAGVTG